MGEKGEETAFKTISNLLNADQKYFYCFLEINVDSNNIGKEEHYMTRFAVDTLFFTLVNSQRLEKALTKLRSMLQQHLTKNNVFCSTLKLW